MCELKLVRVYKKQTGRWLEILIVLKGIIDYNGFTSYEYFMQRTRTSRLMDSLVTSVSTMSCYND